MPAEPLCPRDSRTVARALRILEKSFRQQSGLALSTPDAAKDYLRLRLTPLEHEEFHAVWLDSQNIVIATEPLFRGTLQYCTVHPREVLKSALQHNAAGVIVAHNHPSGNLRPSPADISLTNTLREALAVVDVRLLDHIIVAPQGLMSFAEAGLLGKGASR